jgi:deazaflavin-dependent oxidoreductase (nitroreductase family)
MLVTTLRQYEGVELSPDVQAALEQDRVIDITTTGRKSGESRRIEIWFHNIDGRLYITGQPGRRSWYANLAANTDFTFHLKQSAQADIPARARAIRDDAERRDVLAAILAKLDRGGEIDEWLARSPLVEVELRE